METSIVVPIGLNAPASAAAMEPHTSAPSRIATTAPNPTRTADAELARLRKRVRELAAELVGAQEAARRHLARELHDGVGAELTATRFALAGVDTWLPADAPPQCAAALAVANRSLDAACAATRQTVAGLHAPSLEAGIVATLAQWTGGFATRTGLRTSFVCTADVRLTRLPADATLAVFRVAQEALNNTARHARASCANVRIETNRRHLTLAISDDGIGLPRDARRRYGEAQGHFGVAGMRARCEAFGGALRLCNAREAAAGKARGTTVRARFAWDALLALTPPVTPHMAPHGPQASHAAPHAAARRSGAGRRS